MRHLFSGIYSGKKVLITGHTGFKGSWLAFWLTQMGAEVSGYSLDLPSTPSHFDLLKPAIRSQFGDVRDKMKVQDYFNEVRPDLVFHLAAQALVRESYRDPSFTFETNVIGTLNVLEAARKCGTVKGFVNVTTDKVYENRETHHAYVEHDRLGGHDIYSSSKTCSEILSLSYSNSFLGLSILKVATARAGNVIGGGDWAKERLIPDLVRGITEGRTTEIRSPGSIRPWEHVLEPLSGYLMLGQGLLEGRSEFALAWNFGPDPENSLEVGALVSEMKKYWKGIIFSLNPEAAKVFHEAGILKLDCTKAKKELGWLPVWNLETTISRTILWYKTWMERKELNTASDLCLYIEDASKMALPWATRR